jgi:hypothetical protein
MRISRFDYPPNIRRTPLMWPSVDDTRMKVSGTTGAEIADIFVRTAITGLDGGR